ncbi:EXLDI protein [Streptomyces sp. NPDC041068]|uniref:EXLDI protein n=1 Tax=Streptomyces sp. NPDC041068 TaxID=3155130 RepID=UPI0033E99A04
MPSKTIYVSEGDAELFKRAQALAGDNLSAAIATALRRYVELEEAREDGYEEIIVSIGRATRRKVRFIGALVGEWGQQSAAGRVEVLRVYQTRAGRYAVYADRSSEDTWKAGPTGASSGDGSSGGWRNYLGYLGLGEQHWSFVQGEATLEVFDSLEELRGKLPADFYESIANADGEPAVEDLDI